jgi:hypothetical protein
MLFARINRSDPEKVFVVAKNTYSTASLSNGQAVMWDYVTDGDGVGVTLATAGAAKHGGIVAAGVVAETIAAGSYGLIQVYGYHSAARCRAISGAATVVATGTPLALLEAVFAMVSADVSQASTAVIRVQYPMAFSLGAATAGFTTVTGAVFIKCL